MPSIADILQAAEPQRPGCALPAIRVEIDSCAVRFETDCLPALQCLESLLRQTFTGRYYDYAVASADPHERLPALRYLDAVAYETTYDATADVCVFRAPWVDISTSTLLAMWLHMLSELVRQRRGEYLLHAAAVVRDGKAIVLFGQGESGKTICALDLCLRHKFQLFANNRIKVGFRGAGLHLLKGDAVFRLRYSSVLKYSEALARQIFDGTPADEPSWQRKRTVCPDLLGVEVAGAMPQIATLILLTLDAESAAGVVQEITSDATSHDAFVAMADISHGISNLIRGASFIPLVNGHGFRDIYVPCLDSPELVRRRVMFLETLFATSRVVKIRAPIDRAVGAILRFFDNH